MNTEDSGMDENQFWITVWKIAGSVTVAITLTLGLCTANRHYQTRLLIENTGVDPIVAKWAIGSENNSTPICIQWVARAP